MLWRVSGVIWGRKWVMVAATFRPWHQARTSAVGMLFRSAQADQTDSTATVESTSVPSMSKRTAWKSASRGSVRVIVISVLPG